MSSFTNGLCTCCERTFLYSGDGPLMTMCGMCEHRNEWCQHNLARRVQRGGANIQHSSKPCMSVGRECEWVFLRGAIITRLRADRTDPSLWSLVDTLTTERQS